MTCLPDAAACGPQRPYVAARRAIMPRDSLSQSGADPATAPLRTRTATSAAFQPEMLDLSHRAARQRVQEHDLAGVDLEAGELARDMRPQRVRIGGGAEAEHHMGNRDFLPFRIGAPDDGGLGPGRGGEEHAPDLGRGDVLAA